MKNKLPILLFAISVLFHSCSDNMNDEFILNEDFSSNKHGWTEEHTDFHHVELFNGYYQIHSIDTSKYTGRTSAGSVDNSYLWSLPLEYKIESNFYNFTSELEVAHRGLILIGPSTDYTFSFYNTGRVEVIEGDYNLENEKTILAGTYENPEKEFSYRLVISGFDFELSINEQIIGKGKFKAKSWEMLRFYVSKESYVQVDYLKIKSLEGVNK
jgi:hypothetical protein